MKKTTAVGFLFTQLDLMSFTSRKDWVVKRKEILSKAKELEREQMADAFYAPANQSEPKNFDEYYKQKYNEQKL